MKKAFLLTLVVGLLSSVTIKAQTEKLLKKILTLQVTSDAGANGGSVAWHPALKKYYAVMAGNPTFFLGQYDSQGRLLSADDQTTLFDMRGLWYNPTTKTLQMNGYKETGWGEYILDNRGIPTDVKVLHEGENQPYEQSAGAFNAKENVVYFLNADGNIEIYDINAGTYLEKAELSLGRIKDDKEEFDNYDNIENYNSSTAIYTGNAGAEIGLLNHFEGQIELYNIKTGYLVRILVLPDDAPAPEFLNFAYCNGIYWVFDKEERSWKGYK